MSPPSLTQFAGPRKRAALRSARAESDGERGTRARTTPSVPLQPGGDNWVGAAPGDLGQPARGSARRGDSRWEAGRPEAPERERGTDLRGADGGRQIRGAGRGVGRGAERGGERSGQGSSAAPQGTPKVCAGLKPKKRGPPAVAPVPFPGVALPAANRRREQCAGRAGEAAVSPQLR